MFRANINVPGEEKPRQSFWLKLDTAMQWINDQGKLHEHSVIKVVEVVEVVKLHAIVKLDAKGQLVHERQPTET